MESGAPELEAIFDSSKEIASRHRVAADSFISAVHNVSGSEFQCQ